MNMTDDMHNFELFITFMDIYLSNKFFPKGTE
jgi:hypothetical protein